MFLVEASQRLDHIREGPSTDSPELRQDSPSFGALGCKTRSQCQLSAAKGGGLFWFLVSLLLLLPFRTGEGSQRGRSPGSPRETSQGQPKPGQALLLSHPGLLFRVTVTATTGWQRQGLGHTAGPPAAGGRRQGLRPS